MNKLIPYLFVIITIACNKDKTPARLIYDATCDSTKVYFVNDVLPIFQSNCSKSGCHDVASHNVGVITTTYENIIEHIEPGSTTNSHIYEAITETDPDKIMPPPPAPALLASDITLIETWINQGAINNVCGAAGPCNTTGMSYSADIVPIIESKCNSCHYTGSTVIGIPLDTHAGILAKVTDGTLIPAIEYIGGAYAVMPPSAKLPACDIEKIKSWVAAGAPNN